MKRALALSLGLCLVASLAFAGGQPDSKAAAGPVTLRFSWWGNESRHKATLLAMEAFTRKNPNVKVEPEYGGFDGYYTKLATMIAGGSAPDLMQTDIKFMPDLLATGDVFYDMYKLPQIDISGFEKKFLEGWSISKGKLIGLPTGTNGQTTILNATLMKQLGIPVDFVWTWEDMLEQGKKMKATNPDKYLLVLEPQQVTLHVVSAQIMQSTGKQLYNDAAFTRNYEKADVVAALTYVKQLLDAGLLTPFEQSAVFTDNQMENPMWLTGKAVMYLNYSTHVVRAVQSAPGKIEVAVTKFPVLKNAKNSAIAVQPAQLLCINGKTRYVKESAAFVNFFFNDDDAIRALQLERSVPAVTKARDLLKKEGKLDATLAKAVQISLDNAGVAPPLLMFNAEIFAMQQEAVEGVGFKKATPEDAAARWIQKIDAKLAELKSAAKK